MLAFTAHVTDDGGRQAAYTTIIIIMLNMCSGKARMKARMTATPLPPAFCALSYVNIYVCVCVFFTFHDVFVYLCVIAVGDDGHDDAEFQDHQRAQEEDGQDCCGRGDVGGQPRAQRRKLRHDQGGVELVVRFAVGCCACGRLLRLHVLLFVNHESTRQIFATVDEDVGRGIAKWHRQPGDCDENSSNPHESY